MLDEWVSGITLYTSVVPSSEKIESERSDNNITCHKECHMTHTHTEIYI